MLMFNFDWKKKQDPDEPMYVAFARPSLLDWSEFCQMFWQEWVWVRSSNQCGFIKYPLRCWRETYCTRPLPHLRSTCTQIYYHPFESTRQLTWEVHFQFDSQTGPVVNYTSRVFARSDDFWRKFQAWPTISQVNTGVALQPWPFQLLKSCSSGFQPLLEFGALSFPMTAFSILYKIDLLKSQWDFLLIGLSL